MGRTPPPAWRYGKWYIKAAISGGRIAAGRRRNHAADGVEPQPAFRSGGGRFPATTAAGTDAASAERSLRKGDGAGGKAPAEGNQDQGSPDGEGALGDAIRQAGWANAPRNVLLKKGDANVPKAIVVNVSPILTVDKADLWNVPASRAPPWQGPRATDYRCCSTDCDPADEG